MAKVTWHTYVATSKNNVSSLLVELSTKYIIFTSSEHRLTRDSFAATGAAISVGCLRLDCSHGNFRITLHMYRALLVAFNTLTCRLREWILVDFSHELDREFPRANFQFAIFDEQMGRLHQTKSKHIKILQFYLDFNFHSQMICYMSGKLGWLTWNETQSYRFTARLQMRPYIFYLGHDIDLKLSRPNI